MSEQIKETIGKTKTNMFEISWSYLKTENKRLTEVVRLICHQTTYN